MLMFGKSVAAIMSAMELIAPGIRSMDRQGVANALDAAPDLRHMITRFEAASAGRGTRTGTGFKVTHLISPRYQREAALGRQDVRNAEWRKWAKLSPR